MSKKIRELVNEIERIEQSIKSIKSKILLMALHECQQEVKDNLMISERKSTEFNLVELLD